jgi:magnesium chelatase family protein
MNFARVYGAQIQFLKAHVVNVEADISRGLFSFSIVGLPDKAVEESRDRVSAAIKNSGLKPPKSKNEKVVVSLAPADMKKEGPVFDVPIALAYALASGDISFDTNKKLFVGELSLDGRVMPVRGTLLIAEEAKQKGFEELYVPEENASEAALIRGIKIFPVKTLKQLISHLSCNKEKNPQEEQNVIKISEPTEISQSFSEIDLDLSEIRGQETGKRGLEIAASGGHNIALYGPPGTGKTMLAKGFRGLLPNLSEEEMLEVTGIHSAAGMLKETIITTPPFRSPHHTASYVSVIGGGAIPKPGEATLAHRGVLFLDEFPEFETRVLESLRQPLEDRVVNISRSRGFALFPASFILVAALNPCPCGNRGNKKQQCTCTASAIARYERKLSGPIVDRVDMWIEVGTIDYQKLLGVGDGEKSENIRARVTRARARQKERFLIFNKKGKLNTDMKAKDIIEMSRITDNAEKILRQSAEHFNFSARAYHKTIKLARTIADLDESDEILDKHILEAIHYRPRESFLSRT